MYIYLGLVLMNREAPRHLFLISTQYCPLSLMMLSFATYSESPFPNQQSLGASTVGLPPYHQQNNPSSSPSPQTMGPSMVLGACSEKTAWIWILDYGGYLSPEQRQHSRTHQRGGHP